MPVEAGIEEVCAGIYVSKVCSATANFLFRTQYNIIDVYLGERQVLS